MSDHPERGDVGTAEFPTISIMGERWRFVQSMAESTTNPEIQIADNGVLASVTFDKLKVIDGGSLQVRNNPVLYHLGLPSGFKGLNMLFYFEDSI